MKSKILVVEDNEDFCNLLCRSLEKEYIVLKTSNASEAENSLKEYPDVVILDLKLPTTTGALGKIETGFNLLERIKEFDPTIQVIILTGTAVDIEDAVKGMQMGAFDYILKHRMMDDPKRLSTSIRNVLKMRDLEKIKSHAGYTATKMNKGLPEKGERKKLTILFSDIRRFTEFSKQSEPEDVVEILNEYFDEMCKIIAGKDYNGIIDKFIGDCVMAFFLEEGHAKRACFAAIEMREKFKELQEKWYEEGQIKQKEIDIGIGINTGPVTIGSIGSLSIGCMDYTVLTNEVNKASRISNKAGKEGLGPILITKRTNREVKDSIKTEYKGEFELEGIGTVELYEVIGKK